MKHLKTAVYFLVTTLLLNACQKEFSLEANGLTVPAGTWQFTDSATLYTGNLDSVYIDSNTIPNTQVLHLIGKSLSGTQTFNLELYGSSFTTGNYKASLFQSTFSYTSSGTPVYQSGQLIGEFIVTITSINGTDIAGTFSGSALTSGSGIRQLTNGKFSAVFNKTGTYGQTSVGVLGDSSGFCKPVVITGNYTQGIAMTAANTIQLQVTVTAPGTYSIATNTVNGVTFSKTGTFTTTGVQNVLLSAAGTPAANGSQSFNFSYGTSQCAFTVHFSPAAVGTLGGSGGTCAPFAIFGAYTQGIALDVTNTVQVQVTVASTGTYSISTNSVNGVSFASSGTFTTTGPQTVTLTGSGLPVNAGAQTFTVAYGGTSCTFGISFVAGVAPSGDYFPLTLNSNWTYSLAGGTAFDSVKNVVIGYMPTVGTYTYFTIASYAVPPSGAIDSSYYRKPGGDYYEYFLYSNIIPFDQPVSGEFIFLKDNVAAGTIWKSPNISGTVGGVPLTAYIQMKLLAKAVQLTLGNFNFSDVIKVQYQYFQQGSSVVLETDERWFARNVGEIYNSASGSSAQYQIGSYQVF